MSIVESQITICGHGSGTPSTKNMASYLSSRYASFADNGVRKGLIEIRRLKALTDEDRVRFTAKYKIILGRNVYSQNLRQYVYKQHDKTKKYYSDCSSSICATFQQLGYNVPLLNTAGIHTSDLFETVDLVIAAGHPHKVEKLKVGDCLLFAGNDPSRPLQIGHVEAIYSIPEDEITYTETVIEAEFTISADNLNIRKTPSINGDVLGTYRKDQKVKATAKAGDWFKTDKGWISRKFCLGWIKESGKWWFMNNGTYPMYCAADINGAEYHFDKDGWLIEANRINDNGSVKY
jgi:hypothetical protein